MDKAPFVAHTELKSDMTEPFIVSTVCWVHIQLYDGDSHFWPHKGYTSTHTAGYVPPPDPLHTRRVRCCTTLADTHPPCSGARRGAAWALARPYSSVMALKCCCGLSEVCGKQLDGGQTLWASPHRSKMCNSITPARTWAQSRLCCCILSRL